MEALNSNSFARFRHILFLICFFTVVLTYFLKDRFASVEAILPATLSAPQQSMTYASPVNFEKGGYRYTLTPVDDYVINGIVLHDMEYDTWYSINRTDQAFQKDLCIAWGNTVKNKGFQALDVRQDMRFCWWNYYSSAVYVNNSEISNNHLIASNKSVSDAIERVHSGDQVRIIGKLVNVHAVALTAISKYEHPDMSWNTSVTRDDDGPGACEVIYVEKVEILRPGHPILQMLFTGGLYGMLLAVLLSVVSFFAEFLPKRKDSIGGGY